METDTEKPNTSIVNDRDLLRRFLLDNDEAAFAEIVARYDRFVMSVCRRVVGDESDAEDAFQATFIALALRPKDLRRVTSVSAWLYTVAWRTSMRLIRQRRQFPMESITDQADTSQQDPLAQIASAQDCLVLDEELNEMPAQYREVLVMAYFSGYSNQEIADQYNVSKGTITGRMRQARNMLRVRLVRRGVSLGAIAVAAAQSTEAIAATSPELVDSVMQLGTQTMNDSSAVDLSHLESLIGPETLTMPLKTLVLFIAGLAAVVGLAGVATVAFGNSADDGEATQQISGSLTAEGGAPANDSLPGTAIVEVSRAGSDTAPGSTLRPVVTGGRFTLEAWNDSPVEKWLHRMLDKPVPKLDYPGETPLSEILEQLAGHINETYGDLEETPFRMAFWPDLPELEIDGITSLEDVTVHDIRLEAIPLRSALKLIFDRTVDPALGYLITGDVVVVSTLGKIEADASLFTRGYQLGSLAKLSVSGPPAANDRVLDKTEGLVVTGNIVSIIVESTSPPARWVHIDGEGGAIQLVGSLLVVRQTPQVHEQIVAFLNMLDLAESDQ